jgi:membrane protein DedA with SNARE-associated domain
VAAILGDNVGFAIGRRLGRRLLIAPGPFLRHRRRVIAVGEPFFDRHGPKAVFLGRWVTGLRITAAWMAGATRMSWPTFLFWNALGGIAWATSIGLLAYFVGHSAEKFIHLAGIGGAVLVVLGGGVLWFVLRTRRKRAEALVEAEIDAQIVAEAEAEAR